VVALLAFTGRVWDSSCESTDLSNDEGDIAFEDSELFLSLGSYSIV